MLINKSCIIISLSFIISPIISLSQKKDTLWILDTNAVKQNINLSKIDENHFKNAYLQILVKNDTISIVKILTKTVKKNSNSPIYDINSLKLIDNSQLLKELSITEKNADTAKNENEKKYYINNNILNSYFSTIDFKEKYKFQFKNYWKTYKWPILLMAVSGIIDAGHEAASHDYPAFKRKFSSINDGWWNPSISWANKYKNFDKAQGEQFLFSTTAAVMVTDWYHLSRTIGHLLNVSAISVSIPFTNNGEPTKYLHKNSILDFKKIRFNNKTFGESGKKWWIYVLEYIGINAVNRSCFELTYRYLRK